MSICGFIAQGTEIWGVGGVEKRLWVEPDWGRELWNTPLLPGILMRVKRRASFEALYSDETWREPCARSLEHWLLLLVCCWLWRDKWACWNPSLSTYRKERRGLYLITLALPVIVLCLYHLQIKPSSLEHSIPMEMCNAQELGNVTIPVSNLIMENLLPLK